jgi:DNA-binding response OmpR family regulator
VKKLLIIENDIDTLDIVTIILEDSGFTVVKSEAKIPVREITKINPDAIVIDYLLGAGYGSDLCMEIKENPLIKHIPVILFSASHNLEKITHDCRADASIAKPFDLDDFVQLINEVCCTT